jgi:hypothetical protein
MTEYVVADVNDGTAVDLGVSTAVVLGVFLQLAGKKSTEKVSLVARNAVMQCKLLLALI